MKQSQQRPQSSIMFQQKSLTRIKSAVSFTNNSKNQHNTLLSREQTAATRISMQTPSQRLNSISQKYYKLVTREDDETTIKNHDIVTIDNLNSQEIQKRMKFDPDIRHQVIKLRVQHLDDPIIKKFMILLLIRQPRILDAFRQPHKLIEIQELLLEWTYSTKNSKILLRILLLFGSLSENTLNYQMSLFFYNQARLICNHSKRKYDDMKIKAFFGLVSVTMMLSKYEEAILLLKKSLQYAWIIKDIEAEMHVYQKLGLCYYYLGDLKKSEYYSNRSLEFDYELDESPLKQLSQDILKIFLEKNFNQQLANSISIGLLNKLNIPLDIGMIHKELPDMEFEVRFYNQYFTQLISMNSSISMSQSHSRNSRRQSKIIHLRKQNYSKPLIEDDIIYKGLMTIHTTALDQLQEILREKEFDFEIYTPRHSYKSQSKCFQDMLKRNQKASDIFHDPKLTKYMNYKLGVVDCKDRENPHENTDKYKLGLDQQIRIRLKKKFDNDKVIQNVKKNVKSNYILNSVMKDKIAINHKNMDRERQYRVQDEKKRLSNYTNAYNDLILDLLNEYSKIQ